MKINSRESGRIAMNYTKEKLEEQGYKILETHNNKIKVKSPNDIIFDIKVTSLSRSNAWIIPKTKSEYYVLVYKPENSMPDFFILKQDEMKKEIVLRLKSLKQSVDEYSNPDLEKKGLNFKQPFKYKNKWRSLPG